MLIQLMNVTSIQAKSTNLKIITLSPCSAIATHRCRLLTTWLTLTLYVSFLNVRRIGMSSFLPLISFSPASSLLLTDGESRKSLNFLVVAVSPRILFPFPSCYYQLSLFSLQVTSVHSNNDNHPFISDIHGHSHYTKVTYQRTSH